MGKSAEDWYVCCCGIAMDCKRKAQAHARKQAWFLEDAVECKSIVQCVDPPKVEMRDKQWVVSEGLDSLFHGRQGPHEVLGDNRKLASFDEPFVYYGDRSDFLPVPEDFKVKNVAAVRLPWDDGLGVLVCTECHLAVGKNSLANHFKTAKHGPVPDMAQLNVDVELLESDQFPMPPPGCSAIQGLKVEVCAITEDKSFYTTSSRIARLVTGAELTVRPCQTLQRDKTNAKMFPVCVDEAVPTTVAIDLSVARSEVERQNQTILQSDSYVSAFEARHEGLTTDVKRILPKTNVRGQLVQLCEKKGSLHDGLIQQYMNDIYGPVNRLLCEKKYLARMLNVARYNPFSESVQTPFRITTIPKAEMVRFAQKMVRFCAQWEKVAELCDSDFDQAIVSMCQALSQCDSVETLHGFFDGMFTYVGKLGTSCKDQICWLFVCGALFPDESGEFQCVETFQRFLLVGRAFIKGVIAKKAIALLHSCNSYEQLNITQYLQEGTSCVFSEWNQLATQCVEHIRKQTQDPVVEFLEFSEEPHAMMVNGKEIFSPIKLAKMRKAGVDKIREHWQWLFGDLVIPFPLLEDGSLDCSQFFGYRGLDEGESFLSAWVRQCGILELLMERLQTHREEIFHDIHSGRFLGPASLLKNRLCLMLKCLAFIWPFTCVPHSRYASISDYTLFHDGGRQPVTMRMGSHLSIAQGYLLAFQSLSKSLTGQGILTGVDPRTAVSVFLPVFVLREFVQQLLPMVDDTSARYALFITQDGCLTADQMGSIFTACSESFQFGKLHTSALRHYSVAFADRVCDPLIPAHARVGGFSMADVQTSHTKAVRAHLYAGKSGVSPAEMTKMTFTLATQHFMLGLWCPPRILSMLTLSPDCAEEAKVSSSSVEKHSASPLPGVDKKKMRSSSDAPKRKLTFVNTSSFFKDATVNALSAADEEDANANVNDFDFAPTTTAADEEDANANVNDFDFAPTTTAADEEDANVNVNDFDFAPTTTAANEQDANAKVNNFTKKQKKGHVPLGICKAGVHIVANQCNEWNSNPLKTVFKPFHLQEQLTKSSGCTRMVNFIPPIQQLYLEKILNNSKPENLLIVAATGAGKSSVFQVPMSIPTSGQFFFVLVMNLRALSSNVRYLFRKRNLSAIFMDDVVEDDSLGRQTRAGRIKRAFSWIPTAARVTPVGHFH
eukprot:Nk52_evm120s224 gene=Nk52_evmTU120s224